MITQIFDFQPMTQVLKFFHSKLQTICQTQTSAAEVLKEPQLSLKIPFQLFPSLKFLSTSMLSYWELEFWVGWLNSSHHRHSQDVQMLLLILTLLLYLRDKFSIHLLLSQTQIICISPSQFQYFRVSPSVV